MELINKSFWANKKVLITGHTGFKGSWLLLWLLNLGAKVYCYSLAPVGERNLFINLFKNQKISLDFEETYCDIRDHESLSKWVDHSKPDIVFHLAAQPLVMESYLQPLYTWEVNLMGTLKILESLKKIDHICSVIMITTDKVYLNREQIYDFKENDCLGGKDPYSASKASAEIAIASWRNSFCGNAKHQTNNLRIATARAGNVIGGGDWSKDRIIPDIINSLLNKEKILIRNPNSTRPWQHVLEPLNGYLKLAEYLHQSKNPLCEAYNFGPNSNNNRTVKDLVEEVTKIWPGKWENHKNLSTFYESKNLSLNSDKSLKTLNWKNKWDFDQTIFNTVRWYEKVYKENLSPLESCKSDLLKFQENN